MFVNLRKIGNFWPIFGPILAQYLGQVLVLEGKTVGRNSCFMCLMVLMQFIASMDLVSGQARKIDNSE